MSILINTANHDLRKKNNSALLEKSGEITPERKRWSQSENNTQLWIRLVMEVKSNALKSNIALEPGILGP